MSLIELRVIVLIAVATATALFALDRFIGVAAMLGVAIAVHVATTGRK